MLWFTSDMHFNHERIIELSHRPFASVSEMNQALIDRWNEKIQYHEPVYVLGDFAFHYKDAWPVEDIFHQLQGEKHLVVGNHDEQNRRVLRLPWKTMTTLEHVRYAEHRFVLCHFPIERWWHMERGVLHLHGHCHGGAPSAAHRFDVGVDVESRYAPWSAQEILARAEKQSFEPTDYHI